MSQPAKPLDPALYGPISASAPCGVALERYEFLELNDLCMGKAGAYDQMLMRELEPTPPDFRAARPVAMDLLERSRDLRPLGRLVQIEANVKGALGLHAALHLIAEMVAKNWETLHPGPVDDSAAIGQRRQALEALRDRRRIIQGMEDVALFKAAGVEGQISLRDFLLSAQKVPPKETETVRDRGAMGDLIRAAKAEEALAQNIEALTASADILTALGEKFAALFERPVALDPIAAEIKGLALLLKGFEDEGDETPATDETVGEEPDTDTPATTPAPTVGQVGSAEDATALLDDVIGFYAATAPSSPIALILLRVRELRGASFTDWVDATGSAGPEKAALDISQVDIAQLTQFGAEMLDDEAGEDPSQVDPIAELEDVCSALDKHVKLLASPAGQEMETADQLGPLKDQISTLKGAVWDAKKAMEAVGSGNASLPILSGSITNRAGVKAALDRLAAFHEARDPASAAPIILRRTKGLVDLNYVDILTELSPNGGNPALRLIRSVPKG